jgi:hypothetical protein
MTGALTSLSGAAQRILKYLAVEDVPWLSIAKPVAMSGALELRDF